MKPGLIHSHLHCFSLFGSVPQNHIVLFCSGGTLLVLPMRVWKKTNSYVMMVALEQS